MLCLLLIFMNHEPRLLKTGDILLMSGRTGGDSLQTKIITKEGLMY